jgi:hypothetical protein
MDRKEKPPAPPGEFANQGEVNDRDAALLESPTGREDHRGLAEAGAVPASEIARPLGGQPRSEVTGRHDAGSGAEETADGLNDSEEALRQGAEDVPLGSPEEPIENVPVFDRASKLPQV